MSKMRWAEPVELTTAADRGMMLVIRLTTAGVVTRAGLTIDAMDSLKIATEEACNCLIGQKCPPKRLQLTYRCEDGELVIAVRALEPCEGEGTLDETEIDVIRCILESLTDRVSFEMADGRMRAIELRAVRT